jgi:hypothetical protein
MEFSGLLGRFGNLTLFVIFLLPDSGQATVSWSGILLL